MITLHNTSSSLSFTSFLNLNPLLGIIGLFLLCHCLGSAPIGSKFDLRFGQFAHNNFEVKRIPTQLNAFCLFRIKLQSQLWGYCPVLSWLIYLQSSNGITGQFSDQINESISLPSYKTGGSTKYPVCKS